jgi:hypothetical protein
MAANHTVLGEEDSTLSKFHCPFNQHPSDSTISSGNPQPLLLVTYSAVHGWAKRKRTM